MQRDEDRRALRDMILVGRASALTAPTDEHYFSSLRRRVLERSRSHE